MSYKTDYHIHTTFSDGKAAPEEYIASAISAGFSEIGFSDHLSLIKDRAWSMHSENAGDYTEYINKIRNTTNGIAVKTGMEVDYFPGRENEIELFLNRIDLDYRIGSVHYLGDEKADVGTEFFSRDDFDSLFNLYFDYVYRAASSGLFDIIGHCDYIRLYNYNYSRNPESLYRRLAKVMSKYDVTLEVNTNGKNKPVADFFPGRQFLRIFREENVPVCINSDAHFPARVGQYFDEAYEVIKSAGFKETAVFSSRKRRMVRI